MEKYVCDVCGYVYDEAAGDPDNGIAPGTRWEDLPEDFVCPLCGVGIRATGGAAGFAAPPVTHFYAPGIPVPDNSTAKFRRPR